MKKLISLFLFLFFLINIVNAATIHGTIYNTELTKVSNVIMEIDSIPKQRFVSENGEYSFNLQEGVYTITAIAYYDNEENTAEESITIEGEGEYVLDLFLFPNYEDLDNLDFDVVKDLEEPKTSTWWIYLIVAVLLIALFFIFKIKFKKSLLKKASGKVEDGEEIEETDEVLDKIYDIIKKENRISQKELRKRTNLSEAKVSLIISQLESENKIKKIKKGRSNILVVK